MSDTDTDTETLVDSVIDDPMLDDDWLAAPARRSRLRAVLVVALAVALCLLAGALLQKQLGSASAAGTTAGPAGFGGGQQPAGLPEGLPEGISPDGPPDGTESAPSAGDDTGDATTEGERTSVIGAVVEVRGDVWIVEDLGGRRHRISIGDDTELVRESDVEASDVHVGDRVDIDGVTQDERIRAGDVTLR